MTAHIVFDLRSLIWGSDESCRLFVAPRYSHKMCSVDSFVDLQPFGCNLKIAMPQVILSTHLIQFY